MPGKVIVSVINDLVTDQRVHRTCMSLHKLGFEVTLVGRTLPQSLPLNARPYRMKRMRLLFYKGFLFYAGYNIRLFFYLLFHRAGLLVSNDLDTLLPNYLVSKLKGAHLVYDTHELFCEVPELQKSAFKRNFWKRIERFIFPKLKHVFTVNESIAGIYQKEYGVPLKVVRNIPSAAMLPSHLKTKQELALPEDKHIIVLQGSGINVDRGAEEAVQAMQYLESALLLIIGGGDVIGKLKDMVLEMNLTAKVRFVAKLPYPELIHYTSLAQIGLTLDKDTNVNYRYSLPNKIFDYIHAGVPVLASDLVELRKIIETHEVGMVARSHDPKHLADCMKTMLDAEKQKRWKENCKKAAAELSWEKEELQLLETYSKLG